jgi:hypothetical protein
MKYVPKAIKFGGQIETIDEGAGYQSFISKSQLLCFASKRKNMLISP